MPSKDPILIVGAGAFGLATAHSLAMAGYRVTVLEKDDRVPSRFSASFDLNKIVRAEYADPFYTPVALQAIRRWQTDPLYRPHFRQTGFLNVVSGAAPLGVRAALSRYHDSVRSHGDFAGQVVACPDAEAVRGLVPQFAAAGGPLPGWEGYLNRLAGYAHSADAMRAVYDECVRLGVTFRLRAEAAEMMLSNKGTCTGARTRDGTEYRATTTIMAAGAAVARLLPTISSQVVGRCWGVAHIQLTPPEAAALRGLPVTNVRDLGFFFEPDAATAKLKLCYLGGGYTNGDVSLPPRRLKDSAFLPAEDERRMRRLLRESLPWLADRPLIDAHLCWFADAPSSDFVIDFVPGAGASLAVLSGDSGHGFKMLPVLGDLAVDLLERGVQEEKRWRWRGEAEKETAVAWRADASQDLATVTRAKL